MIAVLLVCAAPVIASYLAYYVLRVDSRTNYSELIVPPRPVPAALPLAWFWRRARGDAPVLRLGAITAVRVRRRRERADPAESRHRFIRA